MISICLSVDDGCASDTRVAKLCKKYHIRDVTFYVPVDIVGLANRQGYEPLDTRQLNSLAWDYEIGSHTVTHPKLTRIRLERAWDEISQSKHMLERILKKPINKFCYPRGYANDTLRGMVKTAGYTLARNTLVGNLSRPVDPMWQTPTVHIGGKRRPEYSDTTWLAEGFRLWKEAQWRSETESVVYHMWCHSWELDRYDAWKDFESLLKEITR